MTNFQTSFTHSGESFLLSLEPPHFQGERYIVQILKSDHWSSDKKFTLVHSSAHGDKDEAIKAYLFHVSTYANIL